VVSRAARELASWIAAGVLAGIAAVVFLASLDAATAAREARPAIVWALPLAGAALGYVLERWGEPMRGGVSLAIARLHDPSGLTLPWRMVPLVLAGTLATHLFGGSAGREGTAVQMGAALADRVAHARGAEGDVRKRLLVAGIAGGFGAVFGTPLAGAVFAIEIAVVGRPDVRSAPAALTAAFVGDATTRALGIGHGHFPQVSAIAFEAGLLWKWAVFAAAVAVAATVFVELTHALQRLGERHAPRLPVRLAWGGAVVVALAFALGTDDFLGLGTRGIERAFVDPTVPSYAFAAKLVFTAVTVGAGFVGGEVTPLFFVGATLGNVLARTLSLPLELGAAVGMTAAFGIAARAPLALVAMALELFGWSVAPHAAFVIALGFAVPTRRGLYAAQRTSWPWTTASDHGRNVTCASLGVSSMSHPPPLEVPGNSESS
jgi:H+/Cl- antiporter ClcA